MRWRRQKPAGEDSCSLRRAGGGWELRGEARFTQRRHEHVLRYRVRCDASFRTVDATVEGTIDARDVSRRIDVEHGRWSLDGTHEPRVDGCVDVDLAFTPATNLLPIRRLSLRVGETAEVTAAWLRLPQLDLRALTQTYRRVDTGRYAYTSGDFEAVLTVDRRGFVVDYGDLWVRDD